MTKDEALQLIKNYCEYIKMLGERDFTLIDLVERFPEKGSDEKAMRWLGFIQGALYAKDIFSLDKLKEHSKTKSLFSWYELRDFFNQLNLKDRDVVINLVYGNPESFSQLYHTCEKEKCLPEFEFVILQRLVKKNFLKRKVEHLSKTFKYELLRKFDLVEDFSKSNLEYFEYIYRRIDYNDIFKYVEENKFGRDVWKLL